MDIERELEILINKHKGKQVGLGEIRLDWFAEDCLREIRRLKSEITRQPATSEEVQRAIELLREPSKGMDYYWLDAQMHDALNLAITALQAYQPNPTSKVQEAIKQKLTTDAIEYLNKKMKQPFVEKDGERYDI